MKSLPSSACARDYFASFFSTGADGLAGLVYSGFLAGVETVAFGSIFLYLLKTLAITSSTLGLSSFLVFNLALC